MKRPKRPAFVEPVAAYAVLLADGSIDPRSCHDIRGRVETSAGIKAGAKLVRVRIVAEEVIHGRWELPA